MDGEYYVSNLVLLCYYVVELNAFGHPQGTTQKTIYWSN